VFPGVNLTTVVREGSKKAKNAPDETIPASPEKSTKFGSIDGTAVITGGVVAINDLEVKAPFLRGDGKGTITLATKEVDYSLRIKVVPNVDGQGGGGALDMFGLVVPLRITGPYDNPSYGTDYLRSLGKGTIDAVGGVLGGAVDVVKGIGNVLTGGPKKRVR
jgi:AsmA protein